MSCSVHRLLPFARAAWRTFNRSRVGDLSSHSRREAVASLCEQLATQGRPFRFTAYGDSMDPAIPSHSELIIEPCQTADVRNGDILMVRDGGRLLVHRVVGCYLWADNRPTADGAWNEFQLIGRVREVRPLRGLGRVRAWVRQYWGDRGTTDTAAHGSRR